MTAEDLRKAILQQAIQGKLLPQDPNDEPASKLLERIREEKARLVKEKKIKKDKNESIIFRGDDNSHYEKFADGTVKCIDDEIPFEIPQSWEWCKINNIAFVTKLAGFEYTKYIAGNLQSNGVPLFKGKNVQEGKIIYDFEAYIPEFVSDELERSQISKKCLLTPYVGTIGNIGIHNRIGKFHLGSNVGKIEILNPNNNVCLLEEYVHIYLMSKYGYAELTKYKKATAQESISIEAIREVFLPIPPINEQKRIVQKIEDILPLIEKYRIAHEQVEKIDKSLNGLLKKSVLQYAIQGKLVPQNNNEEPATALLEKIQQEKLQLLKDGKLKKKDLDNSVIFKGDDNKYYEKKGDQVICIDDDIPFEIPDTWEWTRLGNCSTLIGGFAFKSHEIKSQLGHRVIRISDISDEGFNNNNIVRYNGTLDLLKYQILYNDILIAMTGGTVGKSMYICSKLNDILLLNQRIAIIRSKLILPQYIYAIIKSPYIKEIINNAKNSTNDNISMADISGFLIPLPPLEEQKRIVEALNDILTSIMRK